MSRVIASTPEQSGPGQGDASDWVARKLACPDVDPPGLRVWLERSPAHRADFQALWALAHDPALRAALSGFDVATQAPVRAQHPVGPGGARPLATRQRQGRPWRALALVASVALLALLCWPWLRPDPPALLVATLPGQVRSLTLDDGSVLTLNGASRVRVQLRAHRREVVLESGEVFFKVAHDAQRPFEVMLGPTRVRVLGTVFNLARDGATSELSVYSGRVQIASASGRQVLTKGARIDAEDGRLGAQSRFDPDAGDWREGWLQTPGIALPRLVARLNRRSSLPIVIADPALARLQVSGRFRLDQPEQVLAHLTQLYPLRIQRGDAAIALQRQAPAGK